MISGESRNEISCVAPGADLDVSAARLVRAIRDGEHDADAALHGALQETARVAAGIWKPSLAEARGAAEATPPGPSQSGST